MKLDTYFETHTGIGVLSTADAEGRVNAAIYGRPHVLDEQTVAFIAADRLARTPGRPVPRCGVTHLSSGRRSCQARFLRCF
ncbi:MAG TPA: hypothetical protein PKH03_00275 [Syntrophales bacterium]|nr:hypothetical protein [Syntrophales bacterium]